LNKRENSKSQEKHKEENPEVYGADSRYKTIISKELKDKKDVARRRYEERKKLAQKYTKN